jgi:hypothetical protein
MASKIITGSTSIKKCTIGSADVAYSRQADNLLHRIRIKIFNLKSVLIRINIYLCDSIYKVNRYMITYIIKITKV